jgi:hypothetical protein
MKSLSPDDRKRLRRLKRKAKLDHINKVIETSGVRMETPDQQQPEQASSQETSDKLPGTSIRLAEKQNTDDFSDENIDALIK